MKAEGPVSAEYGDVIAIRPIYLYALASVVSLVGLNIHFGVTVYLSRIVTLVILTQALMVWLLVKRGGGFLSLEFRFLILFAATVCEQAISALRSGHSGDDVRMIFIYLSMMAIFISVLVAGRRVSVVEVAVTCYLVVGVLQGIYGIAQVVGGPRGWPTYQSLMANIPTANDRTVDGYY